MSDRFRVLSLTVILVTAFGSGCARPEPAAETTPPAEPSSAPAPESTVQETVAARIARGEVRGEVVSLPAETDTEPMVGIRHEDIAITTADGEPWKMGSMTMPFAVSEEVDLAGIEKGAKVAFTLEVDLDAGMSMTVTEMRSLDAETPLAWEGEGDTAHGDDPAAAEHDGH